MIFHLIMMTIVPVIMPTHSSCASNLESNHFLVSFVILTFSVARLIFNPISMSTLPWFPFRKWKHSVQRERED